MKLLSIRSKYFWSKIADIFRISKLLSLSIRQGKEFLLFKMFAFLFHLVFDEGPALVFFEGGS